MGSETAKYRLACPGLNDCVPLRECSQILAEATKRCYNNDRSLFCGVNQNYEPYICCPTYQSPTYVQTPTYGGGVQSPNYAAQLPTFIAEGTNQFSGPDKLSSQCGKSLIQGNFYKKLGAFPFVARIGFKSKFSQIAESNLGHGELLFTLFCVAMRC